MTLTDAADRLPVATSPRRELGRIGFLYPMPDPLSPAHWSGTPRSLALAVQSLGAELVPVAYRPPRPLRSTVTLLSYLRGRGAVASAAPIHSAARSRALAAAVAGARPLDALVALGTDKYRLEEVVPADVPVATYDDATFAQCMRYPDSDPRRNGFPEKEIRLWSERQARAARRATACCVSTQWTASSMVSDYHVPEGRVHVVGMGHRPRQTRGSRDWSRPRFLFVGVDWGRKNGEMVVRAFERLRRENPDATLDVVGNHPPLDVSGVVGHGFLARTDPQAQRHIDSLYARATVFVLPSRFDPAGIVYLEAASAGLPVIGTTEGGAAELLGEAAIGVHPDDEDALLAAMRRLATGEIAERLGAIARRRAADSTWEAVAGRILASLGLDPGSLPGGTP